MNRASAWGERQQVALYLAAIVAGGSVGLALPSVAPAFELAVTPALILLLFATFLGVPFARLAQAMRDGRFLGALVVANFVLVPLLVFGLSRFVAHEPALLAGVLLVLLAPCVDYVIVFAGLAGGSRDRLLAATPLLMLLQIALLPPFLWAMAGGETVGAFDPRPFVDAFVLFIVAPLLAASITQFLARRLPLARSMLRAAPTAMVPLMVVTLVAVVGSQISAVAASLPALVMVVPILVTFAVIAAPLGAICARIAGVDVPGRRAVTFSTTTRNSLVVLPLALALPEGFALAPLVVVTQTMVELVTMVVMVALVPRLVRGRV